MRILAGFVTAIISLCWQTALADNPFVDAFTSDQPPDDLMRLLDKAASRSKPLKKRQLAKLPPAEQAAYRVFQVFYDATELREFAPADWGADALKERGFVVIQRSLRVIHDGREWTVSEFRPKVATSDAPVIYLTESLEQSLLSFLGDDVVLPVGLGLSVNHMMMPARPQGKSREHWQFLSSQLAVYPGSFGGWHLLKYPEVSAIEISVDIDIVTVWFRVFHRGGKATFTKVDGDWVLSGIEPTWDE